MNDTTEAMRAADALTSAISLIKSFSGDTIAQTAVTELQWLQAALASREVREWRPISTAPKDGKAVLVYDRYETDGSKMNDGRFHQTGKDGYAWVVASYDGERWRIHSRNGNYIYCARPTHWMGLPAAPAAETEA